MKSYVSLILIVFACSFGWSQKIQVVNVESGDPIVNVSVTTPGKKAYKLTDTEGRVELSVFSSADLLNFNHVGFQGVIIRKDRLLRQGGRLFMEPISEELDEVVLSVSKWEQEQEQLDQKVALISKEEVLMADAQTSADLLQSQGNVYVQKSQLGGGSPMIRGFATNRLLIVVDGVRMNNAIFRGGNLQNIISVDPLSVESAEVIFGPGSVVYGSDAIGGVMSFFTAAPEYFKGNKRLAGRAVVRYSSANEEKTFHGSLKYGNEKWAGVTSFTFSDFDHLRMGKHGPDSYLRPEYVSRINGRDVVVENSDPLIQVPTGYAQGNLLQKIAFKPRENIELKGSLIYSTTGDYSRYDRLIRYRDGQPRSAEWYYGPQEWLMGNLIFEYSSASLFFDQLRWTNAYQQFGESRNDRAFMDDIRYTTSEKVDVFTTNLDMEKKLWQEATLYYGLEYVFNTVSSEGEAYNLTTGESFLTASRYPDGARWNSLAAYANFSWEPLRRLTLQGGVRYNYTDLKADFSENNAYYQFPFQDVGLNNNSVTGSAGLHWRPTRMFQWRANFSTAFRAPNIDDIGKIFDSEPGAVVVPNPGLKPEYAYSADTGIRIDLNQKFQVDLSAYYTWLSNAMVRRDYTYNGISEIDYNGELSQVQAIQNAAFARVYGFEGSFRWRWSPRVNAYGNITWVDGKEELDDGSVSALRHASPLFGKTGIDYKGERFRAEVWTQFNGEISYDDLAFSERRKPHLYAVDANGDPFSPSWYTLNAKASFEIRRLTTVQCILENLTDQRYRTYSSGIAAPGLNLVLSIKQQF